MIGQHWMQSYLYLALVLFLLSENLLLVLLLNQLKQMQPSTLCSKKSKRALRLIYSEAAGTQPWYICNQSTYTDIPYFVFSSLYCRGKLETQHLVVLN